MNAYTYTLIYFFIIFLHVTLIITCDYTSVLYIRDIMRVKEIINANYYHIMFLKNFLDIDKEDFSCCNYA